MKHKYCINCGRQINANSLFCPYCGAKQKSVNNNSSNPTGNTSIGHSSINNFYDSLNQKLDRHQSNNINPNLNNTSNNYNNSSFNRGNNYNQNPYSHIPPRHSTNHHYSHSSFHRNNPFSDKQMTAKLRNALSHIRYIKEPDMSHKRRKARLITSIVVAVLFGVPYLLSDLSLFINDNGIGLKFLPFEIFFVACLFGIVWMLFKVEWNHFWKIWTAKKIIAWIIIVLCISGVSMHVHNEETYDEISTFKSEAPKSTWKMAVGSDKGSEIQVMSSSYTYNVADGSISANTNDDDNNNNDQANYHITGNTLTTTNLDSMDDSGGFGSQSYSGIVNSSENGNSTKSHIDQDGDTDHTTRKLLKLSDSDDLYIFKANSGQQGVSTHDLLIFYKA